jgi:hypothetical protein
MLNRCTTLVSATKAAASHSAKIIGANMAAADDTAVTVEFFG